LDKVYVIENSLYDGLGWETWQLEKLVFSTYEKAAKWIKENEPNSRCEIKEVDLI
jgi:hypothetical protein